MAGPLGNFERFVSWRYLFNRSDRALVSAITIIAVAGVAVGVAALMIVIGVIEGIDKEFFQKIVDVQPHVKIESADGEIMNPSAVMRAIAARDDAIFFEPVIEKQVLLEAGSTRDAKRMPSQLLGTRAIGLDSVYSIPVTDAYGNPLKEYVLGDREVLLGAVLAYKMGVTVNDEILATTGKLVRTPNGYHPRRRKLRVIGTYNTGIFEFDEIAAFVSTSTAREVFGMEGQADFVQVKLKDPFAVEAFRDSLGATLGEGYNIRTWREENGAFFQALKLEKLGLTITLLLVVLVASFNIVGTLIMLVIRKKKQIGLLKAIGASDTAIRSIFLSAGLLIGMLGAAAGLAIGLIGSKVISYYQLASVAPASLLLGVVFLGLITAVTSAMMIRAERQRRVEQARFRKNSKAKSTGNSDGFFAYAWRSAVGGVGVFLIAAAGLGLLFLANLNTPLAVYSMSHLPVITRPSTLGLIVIASMGISLLAAVFPAAQAARLDPVECLRHD